MELLNDNIIVRLVAKVKYEVGEAGAIDSATYSHESHAEQTPKQTPKHTREAYPLDKPSEEGTVF